MKTLCGLLLLVAVALSAADTNRPPARPGLEIKADFAEFNLKTNTAYYSNHVVLVDPPAKPGDLPTILHCHELTARRNSSNKIENIIAIGKVEIDQGTTYARGEHAVYTAATEKIVLTGGQPMLSVSMVTNYGDQIVYDRVNGKVSMTQVTTIVPGSALTNASPASTNKLSSTNRVASTNKVRAPKTPAVPNAPIK